MQVRYQAALRPENFPPVAFLKKSHMANLAMPCKERDSSINSIPLCDGNFAAAILAKSMRDEYIATGRNRFIYKQAVSFLAFRKGRVNYSYISMPTLV